MGIPVAQGLVGATVWADLEIGCRGRVRLPWSRCRLPDDRQVIDRAPVWGRWPRWTGRRFRPGRDQLYGLPGNCSMLLVDAEALIIVR